MNDKNTPVKELTAHDLERAMAEMQRVLDNPPDLNILDLTEEVDEHCPNDCADHPGLTALRRQRAALHEALAGGSSDTARKSEGLIDSDTATESQEALRPLMQAKKTPSKRQTEVYSDLEALIIEILKPQLGQWLNKHLPQIVQSVVEKEIRKLIPDDRL